MIDILIQKICDNNITQFLKKISIYLKEHKSQINFGLSACSILFIFDLYVKYKNHIKLCDIEDTIYNIHRNVLDIKYDKVNETLKK